MGKFNKKPPPRKCELCDIYLTPAVWLAHENGKKHQKKLHKYHVEKSSKCIIVSNLPSDLNDEQLESQLLSFPGVSDVVLTMQEGNSAVLTFLNEEFANKFAKTKRFVGGHELALSPRVIPPIAPQIQPASVLEINPNTRFQILAKANVEAQVHYLVEHFSLKEETVMHTLEICQMLQRVMRNFFPECNVILYGSAANGLGMIDSDLDLFLDLKVDYRPVGEKQQSRTISTLINFLENYKMQCKGYENFRFLEKVQNLSGRTVINVVKHIIRRYAKECTDLFCVPHARCPIVSFVHRSSRLSCDVSVQNGLAVHNTVLVRLFQQLDPRVRPLLFTIRYWAKRMQLVDSKKNRFSSYAITMLTVFYLQNCNPTVLPTVETLQQLSGTKTMCYGWECQFCMDQGKIPKTANTDPLEILLAGFFDYYTEVDLGSKVLCLRTGQLMSQEVYKEYIESSEHLSDFKMSVLNVQDTFELNFNITRGLNASGLEQWNSAISQARSICSSGALWEKISSNNAWGLVCLLSVDPTFKDTAVTPSPTSKRRKKEEEEGQGKPRGRAKADKRAAQGSDSAGTELGGSSAAVRATGQVAIAKRRKYR